MLCSVIYDGSEEFCPAFDDDALDCLEDCWGAVDNGVLEITSYPGEERIAPKALRDAYFKILKQSPVKEFLSGTASAPMCTIDYAAHNYGQQVFNASMIRYLWYYPDMVEDFVKLWEEGYDFESCVVATDILETKRNAGAHHITFCYFHTNFTGAVAHFKEYYPDFKRNDDLAVTNMMYADEFGEGCLKENRHISQAEILELIGAEKRCLRSPQGELWE